MLRDAVEQAARRSEVRDAVARVYAELQHEIDTRRPRCNASGRCCRFDEFGHRLYVTTIELAAFVSDLSTQPELPDSTGCPFQLNGLCGVHPIRPFGCRIFFCDATSDDWQQIHYERFHGQLKRLHEELKVPYRYLEWREALNELGLPATASPKQGLPIREAARSIPAKRLSLPQLPL